MAKVDSSTLTWEDMSVIVELAEKVKLDFCDNPRSLKVEPVTPENFKKVFFTEVLQRFNSFKENGESR